MTTPIKTQCPHCCAFFNLTQAQLNQADATVSCNHCQQSFLVNKYLVLSTNNDNLIHDNIDADTFLDDGMDSDTSIHDGLIHDDMDIEETPEANLEYDSLDSMDAWLTQVSTANEPVFSSKESLLRSKLTKKLESETPLRTAVSSATANDIHANVNSLCDNSWLEKLLEEKSDNQDSNQTDTDLAQLLTKMGVPIKDENKISQARRQPKQIQNSISISISALLWVMGCLVLVLLLFAQYVIFNLDTLMKNPAHAERLQKICAIAACSLPSADLTALKITSLEHRSSKLSATNAFSDVQATLANQSSQAQLLPSLKVSIYGIDATIGEFIAMPEDYLLSPQNQLAAEGRKQLLFTIPVANNQINSVTIDPIY